MLPYSPIDPGPVPVPPRRVNGGWFTGEPFVAGAAWGNVPVTPDVAGLMANLASANPPPMGPAMAAAIGYTRPGNNTVNIPGVFEAYDPKNYGTMMCLRDLA